MSGRNNKASKGSRIRSHPLTYSLNFPEKATCGSQSFSHRTTPHDTSYSLSDSIKYQPANFRSPAK